MSFEELKTQTVQKLKELGAALSESQKLQLALNTGKGISTVKRYLSGDETEVRNILLAEKLIEAGNQILSEKTAA